MTLGYRTVRPGLFRGLWTGSYGSRMFRNDTCVASAAKHVSTAKRMKEDGHTAKDIAKYLGVSRATLYRYLTDASQLPD